MLYINVIDVTTLFCLTNCNGRKKEVRKYKTINSILFLLFENHANKDSPNIRIRLLPNQCINNISDIIAHRNS